MPDWSELQAYRDDELEILSDDAWKLIQQIKVIKASRKYAKGD